MVDFSFCAIIYNLHNIYLLCKLPDSLVLLSWISLDEFRVMMKGMMKVFISILNPLPLYSLRSNPFIFDRIVDYNLAVKIPETRSFEITLCTFTFDLN